MILFLELQVNFEIAVWLDNNKMSKGNDPSMQSIIFRMQMVKSKIKDLMFAAEK